VFNNTDRRASSAIPMLKSTTSKKCAICVVYISTITKTHHATNVIIVTEIIFALFHTESEHKGRCI